MEFIFTDDLNDRAKYIKLKSIGCLIVLIEKLLTNKKSYIAGIFLKPLVGYSEVISSRKQDYKAYEVFMSIGVYKERSADVAFGTVFVNEMVGYLREKG